MLVKLFLKITEKPFDWIYAYYPKPVTEEEHQERRRKHWQSLEEKAILNGVSLLDQLREENRNYDFTLPTEEQIEAEWVVIRRKTRIRYVIACVGIAVVTSIVTFSVLHVIEKVMRVIFGG
jgi:hypothetical protein